MLNVICGRPGSGKSLYTAELVSKAMEEGKTVFSNYPIKTIIKVNGKKKEVTTFKLKKEHIGNLSFPDNTLVVIDEIQNWYGSRDWKNFDKDTLKFFTGHRHQGIDLYVIAQHPDRIDLTIREIAEQFIWIESVFFGLLRKVTYYFSYLDFGKKDVNNDFSSSSLSIPRKKYMLRYDTFSLKSNFDDDVPLEFWALFEVQYYSYLYKRRKKKEAIKKKMEIYDNFQ